MTNTPRKRYFALGDSVSIAYYPEKDALTRLSRRVSGLGAPDLIVSNDDLLWPEFKGQDLSTRFGEIEYQNLAVDGGTMESVLGYQISAIENSGADIVTLTIGGNDLLMMLGAAPSAAMIQQEVARLGRQYREVVRRILNASPDSLLLVTTVYDPTDATGNLPGRGGVPVALMNPLNETIREVAASDSRIVLADVHRHFLGHGASVPQSERWYWSEDNIEPSMDGASEVRRIWLEALEAAGAFA